jgi:hypothetical protein
MNQNTLHRRFGSPVGVAALFLALAGIVASHGAAAQSVSTSQSGGIRITLSGPFIGIAGQPVTFSAQIDTSGVPSGTPVNIQWSFGDGATASGLTVTHTYSAPGTYAVTLTVSASGQQSTVGTTAVISGQQQTTTTTPPTTATARVDLAAGCSNVVLTWPDGTSIGAVVAALQTTGVLNAIWWLDAATRQFRGYSPAPGAPNDLTTVSRLQPVFICLTAPGTLTRPGP